MCAHSAAICRMDQVCDEVPHSQENLKKSLYEMYWQYAFIDIVDGTQPMQKRQENCSAYAVFVLDAVKPIVTRVFQEAGGGDVGLQAAEKVIAGYRNAMLAAMFEGWKLGDGTQVFSLDEGGEPIADFSSALIWTDHADEIVNHIFGSRDDFSNAAIAFKFGMQWPGNWAGNQ